ncbi:MAG: hypothetical protein ACK4SY_08180 [Pyrobaculum sp.]
MSLVAHHYWGTPGGGQLVCASVAYGFDRLGLPPALSGTFRFDPGKYIQWYGIDIAKYPTYTLPIDAKAFGLWARLFVWLPAKKAVKRLKPRLVFTDEITYKPIGRGDYMLVEYIHFPFEVFIDPKFKGTGLAYGEDPYITERYRKFPLSLYWKIYQKLVSYVVNKILFPIVVRDNPFRRADVV